MSSIVQRSFRSFSWSASAQVVVVGVGFARSVLLARLLSVDTFGIYAGAMAIVGMLAIPATLGINGAFLHRAPETEDEDRAAAVYMTLQTISSSVFLAVITIGALIFSSGASRTAIIVIAWTTAIEWIAAPPQTILRRRVVLGRLSAILIVQTIVLAVVAVWLAWLGFELWALLTIEILAAFSFVAGMYLWKPVWRPHFVFDRKIAAYYLRFGLPFMGSTLVENGLQRFDDLYVRYFLGVSDMGFYSRAYAFANYPRSILALPVSSVAGSAFAELANDRPRLSKAFFRTTALLVRSGFLLGGILISVAPELVTLLLGDKWLPMVPIFRLFAVFTLLDPLRDVLGSLFVAAGVPKQLLKWRLVQLAILVVGLYFLGGRWGVEGVAMAVNIMLLAGITMMIGAVRPYVDFSVWRLFAAPSLALALALAGLYLAVLSNRLPATLWLDALVKIALFAFLYCAVLFLVEFREIRETLRFASDYLRGPKRAAVADTNAAVLALTNPFEAAGGAEFSLPDATHVETVIAQEEMLALVESHATPQMDEGDRA